MLTDIGSKSTDFEVHRNWLALTHSLPVKEWYYEVSSLKPRPTSSLHFSTSRTSDTTAGRLSISSAQPSFLLSWSSSMPCTCMHVLRIADQVTDLSSFVKGSKAKATAHAAALSVLLSPGLLIIDHIHFQYNGFLYGILILSLVLARDNSTILLSGLLFATLLCFKHIYLYLAPAYFVYLLRAYCLGDRPSFPYFTIRFLNCIKLGVGIIAVFGCAFGPFALWGQMEQVFRRLFPFSRGLCHAYWAPNVWALYSFSDRVLIYCKCAIMQQGLPNRNSGPVSRTRR
jgi:hypothetical protein